MISQRDFYFMNFLAINKLAKDEGQGPSFMWKCQSLVNTLLSNEDLKWMEGMYI